MATRPLACCRRHISAVAPRGRLRRVTISERIAVATRMIFPGLAGTPVRQAGRVLRFLGLSRLQRALRRSVRRPSSDLARRAYWATRALPRFFLKCKTASARILVFSRNLAQSLRIWTRVDLVDRVPSSAFRNTGDLKAAVRACDFHRYSPLSGFAICERDDRWTGAAELGNGRPIRPRRPLFACGLGADIENLRGRFIGKHVVRSVHNVRAAGKPQRRAAGGIGVFQAPLMTFLYVRVGVHAAPGDIGEARP